MLNSSMHYLPANPVLATVFTVFRHQVIGTCTLERHAHLHVPEVYGGQMTT